MKTDKITEDRWKYSWGKGREIESLFESVLSSMGYNVIKSSLEDDKMKHIDFYVNGVGVDVKASKGINDMWLEVTNTRGFPGWLKGEAEYISFYFKSLNHFKLFNRRDLLNFVIQNVTEKADSSKPYLKYYTRSDWGQRDVIVKVSYGHIAHLKHYTIKC